MLGDGRQEKSYLYVQDCVSAMLTAVRVHDDDPGSFNVYNLGTDETIIVDDSVGDDRRASGRRNLDDRAHWRPPWLGR